MKKRVLSLFLAITLCLTLTPTGALAAEGQPPEQTVSVTQEAETPTPAPQKEEPTAPAENGADENASPASPDEKPTENTSAAPEKNTVDKETGKEAGQNEPTAEGKNELLALGLDDAGQNAADGENGEAGGTPISEGDTQTEIWCVGKPTLIQRSYDGTTDGDRIPIDLTFTDGTNEIKLKEGTGFTSKKTFDSADAGRRTVTVEIELIGDAAAKYKLKAGEETFTIGGYIDKATPELTVSLSKAACTVGEKLLPLLSVEGAPEGAAVTYYYTQYKSIAGDSDYEGNAIPAIDESTAISSLDEEGNNTYYIYAKTGETTNYKENRSATVALTVNEAVVEAASVTKADGTERGTYASLPAALNAAQDGDTVKLLADHVTDADALNALGEDFTFEQYASIVPVVTKTLTLDLNHKTVDYLEVGFSETNEETQEKETLATGNLTVTSEAAYGRILNLLFMAGALDIQSGEIGGSEGAGLLCDANSGTATISGGTVLGLTVSEGASVTVNGGSNHAGEWVVASGATLNITDGTFGEVQFTHNETIAISGGTFKSIKSYIAEELQPLMSLLDTQKVHAFYKGDDVQDGNATELADVTVKEHTHSLENGKCACGASIIASVKTADGTERTYGSFTDALATAVESNGSTLQLLYDVDLGAANNGLSVDSGKFTLDLNGKTLSGEVYNQLLAVSGTANITIKNGKLINTFYKDQSDINSSLANAVQINGGAMALEDIEVTSGRGEDGAYTDAVELYGGSLTVTSGTFTGAITVMSESSDVHPTLKIKTATLHNGITYFTTNTSQPDYDVVKAFFADGSLLFDKDGKYIDITKAEYWESGSTEEYSISVFQYGKESIVKPHTHTIVNGKCSVCGEVEGDGCIAHAVWSPYADYPEWRTTHIKTMDELREKITSPSTKWLDFDNNATVTFLCDVTVDKTFLIDSYYTNIIIDLNGHTLSGALDDPIITANFVSGTGTIDFKNGKIVNTGSGEAIRLAKGKVTLENVDVTGDLSLTYDFVNSLSYIPTFLGGGSFTKICTVNDAGGWQKYLEDMLPKGYYFADITSGKRVSQTVLKADGPLENVTVKPCNHKDADGKSTFTYKPERQTYYYCSICGNICPHEHRTELADGKLHCEDCGLTLTAARRDSKNTITYYIDMSDAFGNAYQPIIWPLCDQTCTQAAMTYYGSNTIDLNGFTVTASNSSGVLFAPYVSYSKMTLQNSAENQGQYVCEYLQVYNDGTLAIPAENNNLTISAVLIKSDGNANLAGGSFGKISVEGEKTLAGLLVSGYYFADTASGEPAAMYDADGNALTELTNVTVKPCSHDTAVCDANGVWKCLCGQNVFVASVTKDGTPTYYTDLQNAFSAADGNTVKLMANVRDVAVSTDKPFTFDLNGYNVYSLTVNNKITIKDSATVKGKITEWLKVPSGMTVGELLEDGYAFKKSNGTWCSRAEQAGQAVGDVSIWPVPIRSVTAANPSVTVAYGQTSGVTLTATVVPFAEGGTYTCQWYKIGGTVSPLDGATDSTYQLPVDLAAGTYTYRLTATEDGYEKGCDFTVTVTPVSIERAAVNAQNLTYNGNAQNPTATVSLGETVLTENRDYTVTATPQTDVGSYTLTVTGKGNYTGKIENVNWKIEPMQLYRFCDIEPVTKVYDGTAVAPIAKSALAFHDANAMGASVTLPEDAYDITNARFTMRQGDGTYVESPEAGDGKSLSFTVTLKSGNYVFKDGTADVMDCDYTTDKVDMFTITKAAAPTMQPIELTVINGLAKTYLVNLPALPTLGDNCKYGSINYEACNFDLIGEGGYANSMATITSNDEFQLTVPAVESQTEGSVGTVGVKITTDNYQDMLLTVKVIAKNKIVPVLDGEITATPITFGQILRVSTITGTMKDDGKTVEGTFEWTNPSAKPDKAGDYQAEWTFTPAEGYEEYATATGTVTIKVNKATPTFTAPTAQENLTYTGQEQALITAGMTDYGTMQYSLTENGTYSQDIPTGTDAGAYTVWYRVIGDENHNDTAPASVAVRIGQKPLTITGVTAATKLYDGTTNADISSVTFDNVTLNRDTDYNVTASFDDASVGDYKNINATVTLIGQAAKNYALEQSSFLTTGSITKAAIDPSGTQLYQTVFNDLAKTYEIDLNQVLDKILPEGATYGDIQYGQPRVFMDSAYYPVGGATIGNGKLSLSINKAASSTQGEEIGTVAVEVKTTNYQTFTLTIHVSVQDKLVPVLAEGNTVSATDITYGQALADSKLTVNGTMQDSNTRDAVNGTFAWTDGTIKPDASDSYEAEWTFTPAEGYEEYATATGTVTIKVNKVAPTFTAPAAKTLTYTGSEQTLLTAGSTQDGTMMYRLGESGEFVDSIPNGKDAGTYTVCYKVVGDGNHNDTEVQFVSVTIKPMELLRFVSIPSVTKTYDGTAVAPLSEDAVTFNSRNASKLSLPKGAYSITNARFTMKQTDGSYADSPEVGNGKSLSFTVTLTSDNYVFESTTEDSKTIVCDIATDAEDKFTITKAAAPTNIPTGTLNVINGTHQTYTYDFSKLLPELSEGQYGTISYGNQPAISLVSQSGYYYDGTIVEFHNGVLTLAQFYAKDGTMTGQIGTVTVKVTTTNYEDFQLTLVLNAINKIKPTPDDKITASDITYGQALSASTITGTMKDPNTGATVKGTFTWTDGKIKPDANDRYEAEWTFTPDAPEYATVTGKTTVKVAPKSIEGATITLEKREFTYNAAEQSPRITGVTLEGWSETITYHIVGGDKATNANDSITLTIEGTGNYTGKAAVKWKITPREVTPAIEVASCTYTGDALEPTVTLKDGNEVIPTDEYTVEYSNNTNAGTGRVTIKDVAGGNYVIKEKTQDFTITAREVTVTITPNGGTYGSVTAAAAVLSGVVDGETVPVTLTYTGNGYNSTSVPTDVDSYTVTASIADNNYILTGETTANFVITPKTVIVSGITAKDKAYDGNTAAELVFSNAEFAGILKDDNLTVTAKGEFEKVEAGEWKVAISDLTLGGNSAANYVLAADGQQTATTATITAKKVTVAITPNGGTYGSVTAATAELSGAVNGETVSVTLTYTGNGYDSTDVPVNAGSYTVTASIANTNYTLTGYTEASFVIAKAVAEAPQILGKVYNGRFQSADVAESPLYTVKTNNGGTSVGTYPVELELTDSNNYKWEATDDAVLSLTFTISKTGNKWATVPQISGWTYGGIAATPNAAAQYGDYTVTYAVKDSDTFTADVPTKAGNYTARFTVTDTADYAGLTETVDFVIVPKAVTVSGITAKDKVYDGNTNATLDFSNAKFDGILENDKLTVTAKGVFEKTEAGKWNVAISDLTLGGDSVANYVLAESGNQTETTATITAKQITVSITPNGGTYGETITPATVKANDVVGEDTPEITLTYTGTANDGTEYTGTTPPAKAGTYTVTATTTNHNYTLDPDTNTAEFAITKRPATVTPDNQSKVYEEKDPDLTYAVRGVLDGETLKGITLTRAEGENAGEYAITATADAGANPNYDVTFAEGTLTIEPKSIKGAKVVLGKGLTANGAEQTQTVEKVLLDDKEIPADSYTVAGNTATAPRSHTLTITAKGNYTGTVKQTYAIAPAKAEDAPGEEIAIGIGKVNVNVQSEGAVPPAALLTDKAEFLAMLVDSGDITADELAQIANGASVDLVLTVKEANVHDEVKAAMAQAAKDCTIGQYLDISLFKYMTVNGSQQAGVALRTTKNALTISVAVPDALINTNSAVNRTYCIVRNHEGTITVLDAAFDAASKTLTFKTDRFSDYAIAYKDTAVPSSGSNPGSNNSSNDRETKKNEVAAPTPAPTPASTSKPSTITAMPQTGDTSNPTLYVVLLVASLLGLAVVFVCKKRNDK